MSQGLNSESSVGHAGEIFLSLAWTFGASWNAPRVPPDGQGESWNECSLKGALVVVSATLRFFGGIY
jgi:hypothetical protein